MPNTARPKIKRYTAAGDSYFVLATHEPAEPLAEPQLHVPEEVAHLVKVRWPKPLKSSQRAVAQSRALREAEAPAAA